MDCVSRDRVIQCGFQGSSSFLRFFGLSWLFLLGSALDVETIRNYLLELSKQTKPN
jgi:hypothetical protein